MCKPDTLQRHCPHCGESRFFVAYPVWNLCAEINWHADRFGMPAVRGDPVPHCEARSAVSNLHYDASIAVAHGNGLVDLVPDRGNGRHQAVGGNLRKDLLHFVGLLACLVDPAGLAKIDEHSLSASRNE